MPTKNNLPRSIVTSCLYGVTLSMAGFLMGLEPTKAQPSPTNPEVLPPLLSDSEYTLGEGDRLRVLVYQVPDFSGEFLILSDGTLTLPLIGSIKVEGMTASQVSQGLSQRYASYLKRPIVTVSVVAPRPLQIAIAGEVNSPGSYTITLREGQKAPLMTDLIRQAGGTTTVADISQVQLRRNVQGQERIFQANLWQLVQKGDKSQNISLRDGDTILIPTKTQINVNETRQLADANFGINPNREVNVTVVGEVNRPGAYLVVPTNTQISAVVTGVPGDVQRSTQIQPARLTRAIQIAGGIKPLADIRQVQVRRYNRDGSQQVIDVDLWNLLETGDVSSDLILQENDTIIIPTAADILPEESETLATASFSPATIRVKVVGEVRQPGILELPPNTPLNQAILAAGNFDKRRADWSDVDLIRLNPNGTVTQRTIPVDFAQGINEEQNPILRNNDVVVVGRSSLASATDTLGVALSPLTGITGFLNFFNVLFR